MSKNPGRLTVILPNGGIAIKPIRVEPSAEELHEIVGGHIELISGLDRFCGFVLAGAVGIFDDNPCVAFCNEEGKLRGFPPNPAATALWDAALKLNGQHRRDDDYLAGPVAIITGDDILAKMREP